tara:strand:+ start:78 stop:335 length:258 start_codon:yes stop_codon:yes gene_type:complete
MKQSEKNNELITTLAELKEYASTDKKRFKIIKEDTHYFSDTPTYVIILVDKAEQNEYFFELNVNASSIEFLFVEEFEEWSIEEEY